jgi:hypothetical protein
VNPESLGWLKERANYRIVNLKELTSGLKRDNLFLTRNILDPLCNYNSLFYSLPIPSFENGNGKTKAKLWLGDRLIGIYLKHKEDTLPGKIGDNVKDYLEDSAAKAIFNFYSTVFPELRESANQVRIWGANRPYFLLSELLLETRTSLEQHEDNPSEHFLIRALFYLDSYIFNRWLETEKKEQEAKKLRKLLEELSELVLTLIVCSLNLTTATEKQAKLITLFKQKSSTDKKNYESYIIDGKKSLNNKIDLTNHSFELRYFFLEAALATILCNQVVGKQEIAFLEDLTARLHLHQDLLNQLMMSLIKILPHSSFHWQPEA